MNIAFHRFTPAFGIATRLALGIGALLALLALVAALGWHGLREGARAHSDAQAEVALGLSVIQVASALQAMRRYEKDVFLSLDQPEVVAGYRKRWQESRGDMQRAYEAARDLARHSEDASRLRRLKPSMAAYEAGFDEAINAHARGDLATGPQARARMSLLQASADIVEEQSLELGRLAARRIEDARTALEGSGGRGRIVLIGLSSLAIAIGALVGWLITRSVTAPLAVATRLVRLTSQGDLTARPTQRASGEIGRLVSDIAGMNEALGGIVGDVRARARAVDEGAAGIQRGNRELSQRTEAQATALEQTAAAVGAFSAAIRENADATASADTVAREASGMARQAGSVTGALLERFQAIEESSRRITEIISLVERIAFQTNILALNAAIEAARAGDAGRGFSVVAAEVRRLSQGTTEAARQITALVEAATRNVAEGGRHAADTGAAIESVAGCIEVLTRSMSDIAVATREQRASVGQISQALSQLDAATQENARLADRSTEAAGALETIAAELVDAVSQFQIEPQQAPAAATEKNAPGMARGVPNGPLEGARPTLLLSPRRSFPHRCA